MRLVKFFLVFCKQHISCLHAPCNLTSCRCHGLMQRRVWGLASRHLEPIMPMSLLASECVDSTVTAEPAAIVPVNASAFTPERILRALKAGARPLCASGIACPADGVISQCGALDGDRLLQVKGRHYALAALLAGDQRRVEVSSLLAPFCPSTFWDTVRSGQIMCYTTGQFMCCLQASQLALTGPGVISTMRALGSGLPVSRHGVLQPAVWRGSTGYSAVW